MKIFNKVNTRDLALFVWYGTLAVITAYVLLWWQFWIDLPPHGEMFASYKSILAGTYDPPFQYRYVGYLLPDLIRRVTGYSLQTSEAINRAFWLWGCALAFHAYLDQWFGRSGAIIGVLGFFGASSLFVLQTSFMPTDVPTVFFQLLALVVLSRRRYVHLLWIVPLGMLFRETVIYVFAVWGIMFLFEKDKRDQLPYAAGTLFLTALVYVGLRVYFGVLGFSPNVLDINLKESRAFFRPALLFGVFWITAWINFKGAPAFLRYTAILVPVVIVANFLFGFAKDGRLWLPLIPVLIPLGLRFILPESDSPVV